MKWVTTLPLLSKWIRKRSAHSCMCGTAAEIRGTFFSCWDQLIPQHISRLWDFEEVISEAHGRAARLHFSTYGKTTSCDPRQISCNTGMLKELSFKAAATHVTNKHVSGLWTLTVTFKAVGHFHHSASPQSTNYRYAIPAFKRTVCSDRHNALFWCWRNEMPPSSKL